ncbi:MAG: WxcM-like domain-containing protein [Armatimonadetes bacterium]|nr:WxcM-like domain-containing protein [Armatimonadota bacterium]
MLSIPGVILRPLSFFQDPRGQLTELFRIDDLPEGVNPAMGYLSVTKPGIERGPHEHIGQTDVFVFLDGHYRLFLWENRPGLPEMRKEIDLGSNNPTMVIVPPGVVHAYKNMGDADAYVLNFPDKLYAGVGKKEPVDEIRHESDPESKFKI